VTRLLIALTALLALATATPAAADPASDTAADLTAPDLAVTVSFDRPSFSVLDDIAATVVVTNTGAARATGAKLLHQGTAPFNPPDWGAFAPDGAGAVLEPGQRVELHVASRTNNNHYDVLTLAVEVRGDVPDANPADNTAAAETTVVARTTDVVGNLYGDRDGDRQYDRGEGLQGVRVRTGDGSIDTRTGSDGRFVAQGVPEGYYGLLLSLPAGWWHDESAGITVAAGGGEFLVRAVRDSSALRASIGFDKAVYAVGDTVRERVTLTNTGEADLSGVTARCVEGAGPNQLSGLGWGDLVHHDAPGITVRAGETRTFDFTDVVPPGGRLYGYVKITCWFSTAYRYDDGPAVIARAEVPGGRGSAGGRLYVDRDDDWAVDDGEAVPGVKVFLVDDGGAVVARAVTDRTGRFGFPVVAANSYALRLAGPWQFTDATDMRAGVFDGDTVNVDYRLAPGANQPDLDAPPSPPAPSTVSLVPASPPAPQASARPANLADTGANVVELVAVGVLLLSLGTGLLFARRSRSS
jgi:LPXTG-motif cell wall-anchored protein